MAQQELDEALYKLTRARDYVYFLRSDDDIEGALEEARRRVQFLEAEVKELRKGKHAAEKELKKITGKDPYDFNSRSTTELRDLMELFEGGVNTIRALLEKRCKGIEERTLCTVCFERERIILLQPCTHLALCNTCADRVTVCPICRGDIHARVQVKVS